MILDSNHYSVKAGVRNEAGDVSGDCDIGCIKQAASLHNTFITSELASKLYSVPSTPAQA